MSVFSTEFDIANPSLSLVDNSNCRKNCKKSKTFTWTSVRIVYGD
jgi:hypothetical protein